jgi:transcription elongation factor GreA
VGHPLGQAGGVISGLVFGAAEEGGAAGRPLGLAGVALWAWLQPGQSLRGLAGVPGPGCPGRAPPSRGLKARPTVFVAQVIYNGHLGVVLSGMEDLKKKLQEEIAALEHEFRSELPKEILKARAHGDLSENAEYHAAKDRQGYVNARLGQLKQRLAEFSMVDVARIPRDKVGLGSSVVVLDYQKDQETTYTLVPSEETDVKKGLISTSSPIGRGLLGKAVGDVARIQSPGGFREMEILRLTTIHDQP